MNRFQIQYLKGMLQWEHGEPLSALKSGAWGTMAYASLVYGIEPVGLIFPLAAWSAFKAANQALFLASLRKDIIDYKEAITPWNKFAHSEEIVIGDQQGLERLLERTACAETNEWGTVLTAEKKDKTAVITGIKNPNEAERLGILKDATQKSITVDLKKAYNYNGMHHFHPGKSGGGNFAISNRDRKTKTDWINFITFNMPYGPEIIGYNLNHTYIPAKREDKTRLVRAKTRDIWRYLGAQCILW